MAIELSEYQKLARDNHKPWEGLGAPDKVHETQAASGTRTYPALEHPLARLFVSADCRVKFGDADAEFWPAGTLEVRQLAKGVIIVVSH